MNKKYKATRDYGLLIDGYGFYGIYTNTIAEVYNRNKQETSCYINDEIDVILDNKDFDSVFKLTRESED